MSKNLQENTTAFANERPQNIECSQCGVSVEPFLRGQVLGLAARWLPPQEFCERCVEKREEKFKILEKQKILDEAFRNSCLSPHFRQRTFSNFVPTPGTQRAYEVALEYRPEKGGLLFFGSCGVGKTHLAAAVAHRYLGQRAVLFISCPEFLLELREEIQSVKKEKQRFLFSLARNAQILVFDDIGAEKSSEWVQETLFVLINHRYEQMLPTIFTTNYTLDELDLRLGKRITSRLVEMCRSIRMTGEDWRVKVRKESYSTNR